MVMNMLKSESEEILDLEVKDRTYICPVCGYTDGFHVSFKKDDRDSIKIILICPECHSRFDPGWLI